MAQQQSHAAKAKPKAAEKPTQPADDAPKKKVKLTYAEQKEWEGIEGVIDDLESQKSQVQTDMNANGDNYDKLADLQAKLDDLDHQLDDKMARWEYLSEYAE